MTLKYRWLGCVAMSGALGATQAYGACARSRRCPRSVPGYSVCKDWPAYDGQSITALSQIEPDPTLSDAPDGTGMYDLKLAVVSNIDGKPLARYAQASVYSSDAVRFDGLSIDTARTTNSPPTCAHSVCVPASPVHRAPIRSNRRCCRCTCAKATPCVRSSSNW